MKCLECGKELIQTIGKRTKLFCNSTCRSNYWQKQTRKNLNAQAASNKTITKQEASIKKNDRPQLPAATEEIKKPFMTDKIRKKLGL